MASSTARDAGRESLEGLVSVDAARNHPQSASADPGTSNVDNELLKEIQEASVHTLEVDFFFPFSLAESPAKTSKGSSSEPQSLPEQWLQKRQDSSSRSVSFFSGLASQGERDPYGPQFGDDGHLLFRECLKTVEVDEITIFKATDEDDTNFNQIYEEELNWDQAQNFSQKGLLQGMSMLTTTEIITARGQISLPTTLKDKKGNLYHLHKVFIRLFSFKVGILRFSITACQPIRIQDLLDMQNSVMRLGSPKQAGRLSFADLDKPFIPMLFLSNILARTLGSEKWTPDESIDRMFVVTMAGISGLPCFETVRHVAYAVANMEWSVDCSTGESYLEKFVDENVYKRHITTNGGLWSCFHGEGGCSLFFTEKSEVLSGLLNPQDRKPGVKILGSSRPLTTLSLAEAVIFQRMYLRNLDQKLDGLILHEKHDARSVKKLHVVHGDLLKFRSKFSYSPLSTTTAGKQQFQQWAQVIGLFDETAQLLETTKDLHSYNQDIIDKAHQSRLDFLTILLGFLGIAQLIMDVYLTWNNERTEKGDRRDSNIYVPVTISTILILCAALFIFIQSRR